jgi:hypothetical protein
MKTEQKIYAVETISLFRHTYYVKAKEESHALDEVVCRLSDENFIEGSQKYISEEIANVIELTEEEFLKLFDKENDYLQNWSNAKKLSWVNHIDYS